METAIVVVDSNGDDEVVVVVLVNVEVIFKALVGDIVVVNVVELLS